MQQSNKFMFAAASCFSAHHQGNSCMKLLTLTQFRYDPYNASVIPAEYLITQSPVKMNMENYSNAPAAAYAPSYTATSAVAMSLSPSSHYYAHDPSAASMSASYYNEGPVSMVPPPLMTVTLPEVATMPSVHVTANPFALSFGHSLSMSTSGTVSSASSSVGSAASSASIPAASAFCPAPSVHGVRYAIVKFKQETQTFMAPFRIVVGETVVVEGDRGENIGVIQEISQAVPSFEVSREIVRKANDKDMATLKAQREREAAAQQFTQTVATNLGLHATIEDVEYQFDLNKLTIFVRRSAKGGFVDFRKLQRSLFREFRCRIWCAYMDEIEAVENGPRSR